MKDIRSTQRLKTISLKKNKVMKKENFYNSTSKTIGLLSNPIIPQRSYIQMIKN